MEAGQKVSDFKKKIGTTNTRALIECMSILFPEHTEVLERLSHERLGVTVTLDKNRDRQTQSQQGYFHSQLKPVADELGMYPDELKMRIKEMTFGEEVIDTPLGPVTRVKSSALADREQYSALIETLTQVAAEYAGMTLEPRKRTYAKSGQ